LKSNWKLKEETESVAGIKHQNQSEKLKEVNEKPKSNRIINK